METIKIWICRTPVDNPGINSIEICEIQNFLERFPDKQYLYTKLYICYDKPSSNDIYTSRKIELPNYMYTNIKPGQIVEFQSVDNCDICQM